MNEKTLRVLEYYKIREKLAEFAVSDMGRELCNTIEPRSSFREVTELQNKTTEAKDLITLLGSSPIIGFRDVRSSLHLAEIGSVLGPKGLSQIAECLRASRYAKEAIQSKAQNVPGIAMMAEQLSVNKELEQEISDAIIGEEEIADKASSELFNIRRKMHSCNDRVHERLNSMVHNQTTQKYLQENIITVRHDCYVLAVKQEYRSMVPGIIHDQSATGATLYIEPMAVVEIGNELRQLTNAEKIEIEKILTALTAKVAPYSLSIAENLAILSELDLSFAKALLSKEMSAVPPKMNQEKKIRIIKGRHPLIPGDRVVPLDIRLGDDFISLIITGPNTGGKTVTLKTIGLFTLMAQSGMHVPADYGTEMAVFDQVYADIGDEQSIEQSLSTFSGHMRNIVEIEENVTPDSLVLFDELGAGTDPTEGAALAQAVLSDLLKRGIRSAATTHYSELKEYALTTEGAENASVEFDVSTLRPTYRLSIGIPGKSNAFEISKRLGLPDYLIEQAKELLSKESIRFEDVIANTEYHRQVAEKERKLAEQAHREMTEIRNQAERERQKFEKQQENTVKKAKEEAKQIIEKARRESEEILDALKQMKKNGGGQEHEIQKLKKQMESVQDSLADPEDLSGEIPTVLNPGDLVHVASMDINATVVSGPDEKGIVQLKAGLIKMRSELSDLRTISQRDQMLQKEKKKLENRRTNHEQRVNIMTRSVRRELDVRGLNLNEALSEVQKFLDDATLSSLGEVCIIHGTGTGVLRNGIADLLRKHHAVSNFRPGRYGEGEMGVTIVTMR